MSTSEPVARPTETIDVEAVVLWLDPDYGDHFRSIEDAAEHYQRWAPVEWKDAVAEVMGEDRSHPEAAVTVESGA
jgi:hypothetical protein